MLFGSEQSQKNHVRDEYRYFLCIFMGDVRVGQQAADGVCSAILSLPDGDIVTVLPIVAVARRPNVWYRTAAPQSRGRSCRLC